MTSQLPRGTAEVQWHQHWQNMSGNKAPEAETGGAHYENGALWNAQEGRWIWDKCRLLTIAKDTGAPFRPASTEAFQFDSANATGTGTEEGDASADARDAKMQMTFVRSAVPNPKHGMPTLLWLLWRGG
ncbi:hypothetical protein Ct61P_02983 [Colletotrichum tofieldiae]|nr:hypothetical protein Ct61P_02983 [Colletotrichum tofieldiae]